MCPPPPSGLSGVPYCLFPGAAGLPLTSRREDLLSRGLRDSRLSPLSSLSCGLMPSWSPGLSVPLPAPRSCSIPLEMLRGALGTVFGAERKGKKKEYYLDLDKKHGQFAPRSYLKQISRVQNTEKNPEIQSDSPTLDLHRLLLCIFFFKSKVIYLSTSPNQICEKLKMNTSVVAPNW